MKRIISSPARTVVRRAAPPAFAVGLLLLVGLAGCGRDEQAKPVDVNVGDAKGREDLKLDIPKVRFTDVTAAAGIDFVHVNGAYGQKLLPETMGAGVAFCDLDGDDRPDLLFVNSRYWPGHEKAGPA